MPHLEVLVGPDRFNLEPCRVNDTLRPHEINTDAFVGRVLVRILDAPGAKEDEPGREYFKDRSRKFCIQIEGRFKGKRKWNGDDIHFGTDFDKFIDFPRTPFNAGMRVAKYIDPCTFYQEKPPSGRPFIMSPYIACMNVICAWPAPERAGDAVVVLRHTTKSGGEHSPAPSRPASPLIDPEKKGDAHRALVASPVGEGSDEEEEDVVPREGLSRSSSKREPEKPKAVKKKGWLGVSFGGGGSAHKEERVLKKYWRFVGFKDEPRVRALLEAHHAKLESKKSLVHKSNGNGSGSIGGLPQRTDSVTSTESGTGAGDVQHGIAANHPTLKRLGTAARNKLPGFHSEDPGTPELKGQNGGGGAVSPLLDNGGDGFFTPPEVTEGSSSPDQQGSPSTSTSKPAMPPLQRITTDIRSEAERTAKTDGLREQDFKLADELRHLRVSSSNNGSRRGSEDHHASTTGEPWESKLDAELGPWRFEDPGTDMVEDNAFIFTNESLSVPKRRKYFANQDHRRNFTYDPDVVYGASFFTDAMDFNTFNLGLGPVSLNLQRYFRSMPVRYTLRASEEEPVFCTISFQLVD